MKKIAAIIIVSFTAFTVLAFKKEPSYRQARISGAEAKIHLYIHDDDRIAISNVYVKVFMGMNFRNKGYWINGVTDANGHFLIQGKTCGDEVEIFISKNGYYDSYKKLCFAKMGEEYEVKDGKWIPYGCKNFIVLRKIANRIDLVKYNDFIDVPATNTWIGFDMERQSFVNPHGTGKVKDFEINVTWDGLPPWESKYCSAVLRFCDSLSGGYYIDNIIESKFPYPYNANVSNNFIEKKITIIDRADETYQTAGGFRNNSTLIIRTRCEVDEREELKNVNYGCIKRFDVGPGRRGSILRLSYVFNPIPNNTNLEAK